jgi:HEAT repeat protein
MTDQNRNQSAFDLDPEISDLLKALLTTPADDARLDRGSLARNLLPRIVEIFNSDNKDARSWALRVLGDVGKFAPDEVIPILSAALKDPSASVAYHALHALEEIGTVSEAVLPALEASLDHINVMVLSQNVWALEKFGDSAVPILLRLLVNHPREGCRGAAAWSLARLVEKSRLEASMFIPVLTAALSDREACSGAAAALAEFGPAASSAVPALLGLVEKGTADAHVARALWRIAQRQEAISILIAELDNVGEEELLLVLEALGEIGEKAREAGHALLALKERLQDDEDQWSYYGKSLEDTLRQIGFVDCCS